jgi:3'-phosphoadenosine 5'-phosphosulfate sulfotransferase (PAPS reductase)/FAD synthetase
MNTVFWDVRLCGYCKKRCFGGNISIIKLETIIELGTLAETSNYQQLLITANVVLSSLILFTLMMEVIRSSETSLLARSTRHHIPENGTFRSHCRENLQSYKLKHMALKI